MLKKILVGVASGYVLKVAQVICNLFLVPFLISDRVLGLVGYGHLAVFLAAVGLFATGLDGWRLSTARRFGLAKKKGEKVYLPLLMITLLPLLLLMPTCWLLSQNILSLLGVGHFSSNIVILLVLYLIFEQLNALSEQCFHASAMSWLVHAVVLCEVILRTACLFYILPGDDGLTNYFYVFIGAMVGKFILYLCVLFCLGFIVPTIKLVDLRREWPTFFESLPLSLKSLSVYAVFRVTVIFVHRFFSPELAGIYSILMVTVRGYIAQLFVAVIRPIIVPVTASINITALSGSRKYFLISALNSFDFVVITSTLLMAVMSPVWLPLWLPINVSEYLPFFMVGIVALGLEASAAVKNLLLVSQGHAVILAKITVTAAVGYFLYLGVLYVCFQRFHLGWLLIGVLMFILLISGLLIPWLFMRKVLAEDRFVLLKRMIFTGITLLVVQLMSIFMVSWLYALLASMVLVVLYVLLIYNPFRDDLLKAKINMLLSR